MTAPTVMDCEDCNGTGDMFGGFACDQCNGTGKKPNALEAIRQIKDAAWAAGRAGDFATVADRLIAEFLESTGQYVTNDASREAALNDAYAEGRKDEREAVRAGLSDAEIDALWLYRTHIHDGELMPQLRDLVRAAIAKATGEPQ